MPESIDFILRLLLFATIHSLLAMERTKQKLQQLIGRRLTTYRLWYNLLSLVMFGWVMLAWQSTRVLYLVPGIWSLVMYALQLLLLIAMLVCLQQTGLGNFLGITAEADDASLCTSGCHAIVRHPLYLIGILFFILNPVMTTRWLTLTILGTIYLIGGAVLEERRLLVRFGAAYARYQRDVPFLLPHLHTPPPSED